MRCWCGYHERNINRPADAIANLSSLAALKSRMFLLSVMCAELIDKEQCAGSEDAVRERINKLMDEWTYLTRKSSEKGEKLQEANRQRMYTAAVKDLEFWLGEVG